MSIHHLEAAAEYELHATSKLVLMALCDDANKITRVTFPGRPKLRLWAGVDDRRVQAIIEELIVQGLLARREFGMPGRNAEFLVFPTDEELEALDKRDPDLNAVSQAAIDRVMKADEAKTRRAADAAERAQKRATAKASKTTTQPVDNSETVGASQCTHANNNGCISDTNGCTPECTPPVSTPEDLTKSHRSTHLTGAVDKAKSDDASNHIQPAPKPATTRRSRTLDTAALAASVGGILADTGISDDGLRQLGHRIIAKASAVVVDPTAYVTQAIRRHPTEWRAEAFDIAQGRTNRGVLENGNDF